MKLQNIVDADIKTHEILWPHKEEKTMKINLQTTHFSTTNRKEEIELELSELEEKLKTPDRTVEDIVRHIQLLKEYRLYK